MAETGVITNELDAAIVRLGHETARIKAAPSADTQKSNKSLEQWASSEMFFRRRHTLGAFN